MYYHFYYKSFLIVRINCIYKVDKCPFIFYTLQSAKDYIDQTFYKFHKF